MSLAFISRPHQWNRYRRISSPLPFDALGDFFGALGSTALPRVAEPSAGFVPSIDVTESDLSYTLSAELPGVKRDDLEIVVENNVLTLKGEKKHTKDTREDDEKSAWLRRSEMRFGSFERRIAFREPIAEDDVKARYVDGVLTITIPKPPEARPKVRTVPVETA